MNKKQKTIVDHKQIIADCKKNVKLIKDMRKLGASNNEIASALNLAEHLVALV